MKAGDLRHRVAFDRRVDAQSEATGEVTPDWVPIGTVWAKVEPLRGREALIDGGVRDEMDTRITCRYSPQLAAVAPKDRALFNGSIYNIVSVAHVDMNHRTIEFLAKSGLNDG